MELSTTLPPDGNRVIEGEERVRSEEGDRLFAGNRWPRQETLTLLEIRSDMDVAFRDSGLKAPLWEGISRKMSQLGYNRSSKKCKEKFENVFKYHRRTKQFRSSKSNGKMYRFFDQLEALDSHQSQLLPALSPPSSDNFHTTNIPMAANPVSVIPNTLKKYTSISFDMSTDTASTSSKESDGTRKKKKRKLGGFFDRLMKEVIEKQENLQRKFLEALEKCEQDRIAREEAWRIQESTRIQRERELLVQERSISAAKDVAVLAFLQKFSDQAGLTQFPEINPIIPVENKAVERQKRPETQENSNGGGESFTQISGCKWPKEEVDALIRLRSNADTQYQENAPRGPLWEDISVEMKKLGYDKSAKRCKEKWENMNKYFKRVKVKSKKRPEDSKTCAYFNQLDALYKEKTKKLDNSGGEFKPEELLMHMMSAQEERRPPESMTEDGASEDTDQDREDHVVDDHFHVVPSNPSTMAIME